MSYLPAIRLRFDHSLAVGALLTWHPESIIALGDATADDAFLLRGVVGGGFGFSGGCGGRGGGGGATGGGLGTLARVDFCFHCHGFFLDDAETTFDRVVSRTWGTVNQRK